MKEETKGTPDREAAGTFQLTDEEYNRLIARIDEQYKAYCERVKDLPMPPHLRLNLAGRYENAEYPPNLDAYGSRFGGYPTDAQECFFFSFVVMGYVLRADSAAKMQPYLWCFVTTAIPGVSAGRVGLAWRRCTK